MNCLQYLLLSSEKSDLEGLIIGFLKVAGSSRSEDTQLSDKILSKVQGQADGLHIPSIYWVKFSSGPLGICETRMEELFQ